MLEIPESTYLAKQINEIFFGKEIKKVTGPTNDHKFCWFNDTIENYQTMLEGKKFTQSTGYGAFLDLVFDDITITIADGMNPLYTREVPIKYQLLLEFTDKTYLTFMIGMYGGVFVHKGDFDNPYYQGSLKAINPLSNNFDYVYFKSLLTEEAMKLSSKAFLATNQRIPGLGNGVLQDILFNARINPKRKMNTISEEEYYFLFQSLKNTLRKMADEGGRDTEKDLFGYNGKYHTILSKKTKTMPCPCCGDIIKKEAYLGGSIYYCPTCQKMN